MTSLRPTWRVHRHGMRVLAWLAMAGLAATVPAAAAPGEFPYVEALKGGKESKSPPRLVLRSSPKLDLVMIVASIADQQRLFRRALSDNPLGTYWVNNTRQFSFEEAPKHLRELRAQGLWGERLLELAMHLSEPPALERVVPWSENLLSAAGGSADETPAERLDRFVEELRLFAAKCRFVDRLAEKQELYRALEEVLTRSFAGQDPLAVNAAFWGVKPRGDFHLIPSPMMTGGYLTSVTAGGRTHQFLAFGPARQQELANQFFLHHLVYHELGHPLVDPILAEHGDELDASKQLWFAVSSQLSGKQSVLTWNDCVGEHLLRAYTIRLLRETDPVLAELSVDNEEANGFLYTRRFLALLDAYAAGRDRWNGLAGFIPEMSSRLAALAENYADLDPRTRPPDFAVVNAGFEGQGDGWLLKGWELIRAGSVAGNPDPRLAEVARDPAAAHAGRASVRITVRDDTRDLVAVEQGPLAVRAGGNVRISGWVKTDNVVRKGTQQRVCGLYVLFMDRQGTVLSRGETDSAIGTLDWTALSGEFIAPPGTAHARMGILLGMSGTAWFDDLDFERLD